MHGRREDKWMRKKKKKKEEYKKGKKAIRYAIDWQKNMSNCSGSPHVKQKTNKQTNKKQANK